MARPIQDAQEMESVRPDGAAPDSTAMRIKSEDLFRSGREIEIDHQGRIYRLRLTQLNKLILTA